MGRSEVTPCQAHKRGRRRTYGLHLVATNIRPVHRTVTLRGDSNLIRIVCIAIRSIRIIVHVADAKHVALWLQRVNGLRTCLSFTCWACPDDNLLKIVPRVYPVGCEGDPVRDVQLGRTSSFRPLIMCSAYLLKNKTPFKFEDIINNNNI